MTINILKTMCIHESMVLCWHMFATASCYCFFDQVVNFFTIFNL